MRIIIFLLVSFVIFQQLLLGITIQRLALEQQQQQQQQDRSKKSISNMMIESSTLKSFYLSLRKKQEEHLGSNKNGDNHDKSNIHAHDINKNTFFHDTTNYHHNQGSNDNVRKTRKRSNSSRGGYAVYLKPENKTKLPVQSSLSSIEKQQVQSWNDHPQQSSSSSAPPPPLLRNDQDQEGSPPLLLSLPLSLSTVQGQYQKYLIFRHVFKGQGTGNVMTGLFAAQLLGKEFDRTVCVDPMWESFHMAFDYANPTHKQQCQQLLTFLGLSPSLSSSSSSSLFKDSNIQSKNITTIQSNNYDDTAVQSECNLQQILHSNDTVVYFTGNTYPRWPQQSSRLSSSSSSSLPSRHDNIFFQYYQPSKVLTEFMSLSFSSFATNPTASNTKDTAAAITTAAATTIPTTTYDIVVHLRQPDGILDERQGLDDETFLALGHYLPNNNQTFLVTNRVEWYDYFATNFGWSHPSWSHVRHSAMPGIQWGTREVKENNNDSGSGNNSSSNGDISGTKTTGRHLQPKEEWKLQDLQMWTDWYTLLTAKKIYHTHSDFSISAARWNPQIESWTIRQSSSTTTSTSNGKNNNNTATNHHRFGKLNLVRDFEVADHYDDNSESGRQINKDDPIPPPQLLLPPLVDRTEETLKYCNISKAAARQELMKSRLHFTLALARKRRMEREDDVDDILKELSIEPRAQNVPS